MYVYDVTLSNATRTNGVKKTAPVQMRGGQVQSIFMATFSNLHDVVSIYILLLYVAVFVGGFLYRREVFTRRKLYII